MPEQPARSMNSIASDVSEGLIGRLWEAVTMEYSRQIGQRDKLDETSLGAEAADEIARLRAEIATLSPPLPSLEVERLYVLFSDDGQHIRKWSREPFEGSKPVDAALSALPLDGGLK